MDSLLAAYSSSDEEEENNNKRIKQSSSSSSSQQQSKVSSSSTNLSSSLPQPKQQTLKPQSNSDVINPTKSTTKPSSLFSSLPQPKSQSDQEPPKKVVLLRPLAEPAGFDDDDDVEEEARRKKKQRESQSSTQAPSVNSFLSSILPAPRNSSTLGVMHSASRSGRRAVVIETDAPALSNSGENELNKSNQNASEQYVNYYDASYPNYESTCSSDQYSAAAAGSNVDYGSYQGYDQNASGSDMSNYESYYQGNYGAEYGQAYGDNWGDGLSASGVSHAPLAAAGAADLALAMQGKRRRNEIPTNIVEVRQDELIKNRPREDQVKSTGIAFGPAYQPVSTKGKPTKLHKRKHQIGSLYFDMKQREQELAERRSQGFLTKAQTQGKYGW